MAKIYCFFVNHSEWWNEESYEALKRKTCRWRIWKALQTPESHLEYNQAWNTYPSISQKAISSHKIWVREKMTTELKTGSKSWWWTARRLTGKGRKWPHSLKSVCLKCSVREERDNILTHMIFIQFASYILAPYTDQCGRPKSRSMKTWLKMSTPLNLQAVTAWVPQNLETAISP